MSGWMQIYQSKVTTAEKAVCAIQSGMRAFLTGNCSVPQRVIAALVKHAPAFEKPIPRTLGDSFIHVSKLTHIVPVSYQVPEHHMGEITEVEKKIGYNCGALIDVAHPQFREELEKAAYELEYL